MLSSTHNIAFLKHNHAAPKSHNLEDMGELLHELLCIYTCLHLGTTKINLNNVHDHSFLFTQSNSYMQ